jgi:thiaminase
MTETLEGYEREIAGRRFTVRPTVHPASRALSRFARSLAFEPYVCGVVSLWAYYRSYQHAVAAARTASPRFRRILRRIRGVNVVALEERLRRIADDLLANATPEESASAEDAFVQTARHRIEFWAMILSP